MQLDQMHVDLKGQRTNLAQMAWWVWPHMREDPPLYFLHCLDHGS